MCVCVCVWSVYCHGFVCSGKWAWLRALEAVLTGSSAAFTIRSDFFPVPFNFLAGFATLMILKQQHFSVEENSPCKGEHFPLTSVSWLLWRETLCDLVSSRSWGSLLGLKKHFTTALPEQGIFHSQYASKVFPLEHKISQRKTFYLQLSWPSFQSILKQKALTLCAGLLLFCIINDRRSNIWGFETLVRQNPRYSCTFFSLNNEVIKKHSLVGLQHKRSSCTITAQRLCTVATFYSAYSLQLSCIHVLCLLNFRLWIKNKRWTFLSWSLEIKSV